MTDHEFETISYVVEDGLATIELARPEKRNAMNRAMFGELGEAAERAGGDDGVRAVVVRARGQSFCAGLDLSAVGELAQLKGQAFRSFVTMAQRPFRLLALMPKATI